MAQCVGAAKASNREHLISKGHCPGVESVTHSVSCGWFQPGQYRKRVASSLAFHVHLAAFGRCNVAAIHPAMEEGCPTQETPSMHASGIWGLSSFFFTMATALRRLSMLQEWMTPKGKPSGSPRLFGSRQPGCWTSSPTRQAPDPTKLGACKLSCSFRSPSRLQRSFCSWVVRCFNVFGCRRVQRILNMTSRCLSLYNEYA